MGLTVAGLSGCTDFAGYDLDYFWGNIPALSTLRGSVTYDPYELPRLPAEHSIPVVGPLGDVPAPYAQAQLDSAASTLRSPYAGDRSDLLLARGQAIYHRQCTPCHGPAGAGNGPVVGPGKFPFAPSLVAGTASTRSEAYIYAIVDVGRGLMPPYGEKISHLDRWAVAAYVKQLQAGAAGAAPSAQVAPEAVPVPPTAGGTAGPRP